MNFTSHSILLLGSSKTLVYVRMFSLSVRTFDLCNRQLCHQDNMSVWFIPPYAPLVYSKTGVYMGIHCFSYFCSKTKIMGTCLNCLSEVVLTCTHNLCFEQKKHEKYLKKSSENYHFFHH